MFYFLSGSCESFYEPGKRKGREGVAPYADFVNEPLSARLMKRAAAAAVWNKFRRWPNKKKKPPSRASHQLLSKSTKLLVLKLNAFVCFFFIGSRSDCIGSVKFGLSFWISVVSGLDRESNGFVSLVGLVCFLFCFVCFFYFEFWFFFVQTTYARNDPQRRWKLPSPELPHAAAAGRRPRDTKIQQQQQQQQQKNSNNWRCD